MWEGVMGMYDTIMISMKCPHCGETSEIGAQTKELDCELNVFRNGKSIHTNQYNYLDCIADCKSDICMAHELKRQGYRSGFGRTFWARIYIHDGKVTSVYRVLNDK